MNSFDKTDLKKPLDSKNCPSTGFSLLEVLVSLVILSIGLLGIAELQLRSLKNTQDLVYRNTAIMLAQDIIQRMRSNFLESSKGLASKYMGTTGDSTALTKCTSPTASYLSCPPALMADADLYEWKTTVSNLLPNGVGTICIAKKPSDATIVTPIECDPKASSFNTTFAIIIKWKGRDKLDKSLKIAFDPGETP